MTTTKKRIKLRVNSLPQTFKKTFNLIIIIKSSLVVFFIKHCVVILRTIWLVLDIWFFDLTIQTASISSKSSNRTKLLNFCFSRNHCNCNDQVVTNEKHYLRIMKSFFFSTKKWLFTFFCHWYFLLRFLTFCPQRGELIQI